MRKTWIVVVIAVASVIAAVIVWVANRATDRNWAASCANCKSFVWVLLEDYAKAHEGWYPRGERSPMDSLAKCVTTENDVHFFTSHKLQPKLLRYWRKNRTFHADYTCYRYVEGLRNDDPDGLVLLYYREPTLWECKSHKMQEFGRPVALHPPDHSWDFLSEEKFQKRLNDTHDYLRERTRNEQM